MTARHAIGTRVPAQIRIRAGEGAAGLDRLEASIVGVGFAPHRHDTYAIGITLSGVQTFRYRGATRHCMPGEAHILHPDELHDGRPGTEAGFRYRILYVDPSLIRQALGGGGALPFVSDPIVSGKRIDPDLVASLSHLSDEVSDQRRVELAVSIAAMLEGLSRARKPPRAPGPPRGGSLYLAALTRVRDHILADPVTRHSAHDLELIAGLDRWTLARQFRAAFGTSPSRYRTLRQLDLARRALSSTRSLSDVALAAGFSDHAHFSRMFRRAYGLSPSAWRSAHVTTHPRRSRQSQ